MLSFHFTRLSVAALLSIWAMDAGALSPPRDHFGLDIEIQNATGHEMRICWLDSYRCRVETIAPGASSIGGLNSPTPFPQSLDRYFEGGYITLCDPNRLVPKSVISLVSKKQDGKDTIVKYVVSEQTYRRECAENGLPRDYEPPSFLKK